MLVHCRPAEASTTVGDHDCLFVSVADHSCYEPSQQSAYRQPCGLLMGAPQPCGSLPRLCRLATGRVAELPKGLGFKPLSVRTGVCLCVYFDGYACWIRTSDFSSSKRLLYH